MYGTSEGLNLDIATAMRSTLVELELVPKSWICIIDVIPAIISKSPTERLRCEDDGTTHSPLVIMTGIRPRLALVQIMSDETGLAISLLK